MTLADARALEPELVVAEMDAGADRHWLERLARHCLDWTPRVSLAAPDGITLDIAGVDHLFGGEAGLCAQVEDGMAGIGMALRWAAASTPEAAQALARHGALPVWDEREAIRALPVLALGLDGESTLALNRAGLKRVGDLTVRPAAAIAARFGVGAVSALSRLTGEELAPIDALRDPEPLHFERRFAEPIGLQATIAAVFMEVLQEAAGVLGERDLGAGALYSRFIAAMGPAIVWISRPDARPAIPRWSFACSTSASPALPTRSTPASAMTASACSCPPPILCPPARPALTGKKGTRWPLPN
jgi:protein ImuB